MGAARVHVHHSCCSLTDGSECGLIPYVTDADTRCVNTCSDQCVQMQMRLDDIVSIRPVTLLGVGFDDLPCDILRFYRARDTP